MVYEAGFAQEAFDSVRGFYPKQLLHELLHCIACDVDVTKAKLDEMRNFYLTRRVV